MDIDPNQPIIEISPKRLFCPAHGEHFAENWPRGFAFAGMTMLEAVFESEKLHEAIRTMGGQTAEGLDPKYINLITNKRPFCYFVERDVIRNALAGADIGTIGICRLCGQSGAGGPYRLSTVGGVTKLPHVCFECALNTGENFHKAHPNGGVWHG